MKPLLAVALATFTLALASSAAPRVAAETLPVTLTVAAGQHDRQNTPVRVTLKLPGHLACAKTASLLDETGRVLTGQLTKPRWHSAGRAACAVSVVRELHFVLPHLGADESLEIEAVRVPAASRKPTPQFAWHDTPGNYAALQFGGRPVMQYMYKPYDDSTPENREETYKVYHHLYDPAGERLVTKGPGGLYSHHRGLFYGFFKITYADGKRADTWHCPGDDYQSHEGFLASDAGPVLGRHRVAVDWHGAGKEVILSEEREMSVYRLPGGHLVEFASRLRSRVGEVRLDGDPQHCGFQFRASNEVASATNAETYYLRPDGKGKEGETRNWPDDPRHANLPWNAMSFVLGGQRYTAAYLDTPANPKEARYSERDYGRFGSFFVYELDGEAKLDASYRLWLQAGEMTVEQVAALSHDFVDPPTVVVSKKRRARPCGGFR